jgi:hypothetical protein
VEQSLIGLIFQAKVLQKLVSQSHQLVHPDILLLVVGNFEEIQNYFVNAHVAEQPLLVFARFDALFKHLMFCN